MNVESLVKEELSENITKDNIGLSSLKLGELDILKLYNEFCVDNKRKVISDININMSLSGDLGLDSLNQVELLVFIERRLKISINPDEYSYVNSLMDLLNLINKEAGTQEGQDSLKLNITDLHRYVTKEIPHFYNDVTEQEGRKLRIKDKIVYDFASANYLGLDLDQRIFERISSDLLKWGTHPSWSRAIASPQLYKELEQKISEVMDVPEVLVFPTITLIHMGILPLLATSNTLFLMDERVHKSVQEGVDLACAKGAHKKFFAHNDINALRSELNNSQEYEQILVCIDGVYSMTGLDACLPEIIELIKSCPKVTLYIDDAHGFGLWGHSPSETNPYGIGGGGLLKKYKIDIRNENVIYVAGLSKAFSSLAAFVTCRSVSELENFATASTFMNSGPCPTASLSSALTGLEISQSLEGDQIRKRLYDLTKRFITGIEQVGLVAKHENYFPLVSVEIGTIADVIEASKILWNCGILITPAVFPNAPIKQSMLRFTITAANTDEEIDAAIDALEIVRNQIPLAPYN
ncbi:aminotransferase class I/II-fold pyridoxal phosphate-dependent enzyme [Acinetobacter sp. 1124_18A]|uniref:aminotransferase class I/II-fold pyridoxal phosphate-dependent enzyme n=1 Tax=Acinetobacter sp. 1124_18A TaxID=2605958 RepID=UPI004059B9C4